MRSQPRADLLYEAERRRGNEQTIRLAEQGARGTIEWQKGDTAWPKPVQQIIQQPGLSKSAEHNMLGENPMRLYPRLRDERL